MSTVIIRPNAAIQVNGKPARNKVIAIRRRDEHVRKFVARVINTNAGASIVLHDWTRDILSRGGEI